jgi:hypothetical protein
MGSDYDLLCDMTDAQRKGLISEQEMCLTLLAGGRLLWSRGVMLVDHARFRRSRLVSVEAEVFDLPT